MKPQQAAWHSSAMIGIGGECAAKSGLDVLATKVIRKEVQGSDMT